MRTITLLFLVVFVVFAATSSAVGPIPLRPDVEGKPCSGQAGTYFAIWDPGNGEWYVFCRPSNASCRTSCDNGYANCSAPVSDCLSDLDNCYSNC